MRRERRRRTWLLALAGAAVLAAGITAQWRYVSHNPARSEAHVIDEFVRATQSSPLCHAGDAGKGMDNRTPWSEQVLLSAQDPREYAERLNRTLNQRGYRTTIRFVDDATGDYDRGKSYWQIEGRRSHFAVVARVSTHLLTLNNCFSRPDRDDVASRSESVAVIAFHDEHDSRGPLFFP